MVTRFTISEILTLLHARIVEYTEQERNASRSIYEAGQEAERLVTLRWTETLLNGTQDEATEAALRELGIVPQKATTYATPDLIRVLRHWAQMFENLSNENKIGHHVGGGWIEYGQSVAYGHLAIMLQGHWDDKIAAALAAIDAQERAAAEDQEVQS